MESRESINLEQVKVMASESPSSYHVDPRSDNFDEVTRLSQAPLPLASVTDGSLEKKKRGRPRRYEPDGPVAHTLSPLPVSNLLLASSGFSHENHGCFLWYFISNLCHHRLYH